MTLPDGPETVVVAGAGLAGLRVTEELRSQGYRGSVTLVGAETVPPYDRPPLSKQLMAGATDDTTLRPELESLGATFLFGERATGLAGPGSGRAGAGRAGTVLTENGEHSFDRLVIATGASPVRLPGPGRQRFLRTIGDALELRALLRPGLRLVIIGAGWIGAELATAAVARGCQVTVLEAAAAPLAVALGAEVGAVTAGWHAAAGVDLRLDTAVSAVCDGGLELAGGQWLAADEIVTAVGVRPVTDWLAGSGVACENGVAVDQFLRSSVPGVYAVGDCAAFWSVRFGRRIRPEHWDVALRAPVVLAANLLGAERPYDPVPYFWSEQFGRMLQYAGDHRAADELVWRGDPGGQKWSVCWLAGGRLVALLAVGLPRDLLQGRRLIEAGVQVDAVRLADPAVPVSAAAPDS